MGLAMARAIASSGGSVFMIDLKPKPEQIAESDTCIYAQGDLTDPTFVKSTIDAAAARFGRIDYLANVAGVLWFGKDRSLLDMDLGVWDEVFSINLKSMVHTVRAAVPHMRKAGGGAMVHFSTIQCLRGDAIPQDAYSASKAGVGAMSKSLAMQLAAEGIRSNTIFPGPTLTPHAGSLEHRGESHCHWPPYSNGPCRTAGRVGQRRVIPAVRRGVLHHRHRPGRRWRYSAEVVSYPHANPPISIPLLSRVH